MTEAQIQQAIHYRYEKNSSTPQSTSEDYLVRRQMINDAIEKWGGAADAENTRWRELFTTTTLNLTTATTYALPTNFSSFSSYLKVTSTGDDYYVLEHPNNVLNRLRGDTSSKFMYVTGTPGAYILNVNPTPTTTGWVTSYSYYKMPTLITAVSDIPEMSRPYFIIYDVLSSLFEEERPDLSNKYLQMAADLMKSMLIDNELLPAFHPSSVTSLDTSVNNLAFGT